MPPKKIADQPPVVAAPEVVKAPQWRPEELLAIAHLGPATAPSREMYEAAQAYVKAHGTEIALGPATRAQ